MTEKHQTMPTVCAPDVDGGPQLDPVLLRQRLPDHDLIERRAPLPYLPLLRVPS